MHLVHRNQPVGRDAESFSHGIPVVGGLDAAVPRAQTALPRGEDMLYAVDSVNCRQRYKSFFFICAHVHIASSTRERTKTIDTDLH
jgi:hypothetical protein